MSSPLVTFGGVFASGAPGGSGQHHPALLIIGIVVAVAAGAGIFFLRMRKGK